MSNIDAAKAYIAAWNARDPDAVVATLTSEGTYEDPGTGGPIGGDALKGYIGGLLAAFPDLSFELASIADAGPSTVAFQWIMRGTNSGSLNGLPPTNKPIEVPGADFCEVENGKLKSVRGYFDGGAVPRQIGLDIVVQPSEIGPFRFGTSVAVQTGKMQAPEAFSITSLEALNDETAEIVREGSRAALVDMMGMDGFIGATTAKVGLRMVTISAWDDADAPRQVMREGAHAEAMKGMLDGSLAKAGFTSVYVKARVNPYLLRCEACGKMRREPAPGADCDCGAKLPDRLPYW